MDSCPERQRRMNTATALSTIASILLGGGILTFIQFLISRHDNRKDKNSEVMKAINVLDQKVDTMSEKGDERNAVSMRVRILRFRDEMLLDQGHTHDSFQQVLSDIDEYEKYCIQHPEFKNNQTVATIKHIKENYLERLEKHDFL